MDMGMRGELGLFCKMGVSPWQIRDGAGAVYIRQFLSRYRYSRISFSAVRLNFTIKTLRHKEKMNF